jgi:hypothetical protein
MAQGARDKPTLPEIADEPGMAERFQRGLQRALNIPAKHRTAPIPKPKARSVKSSRVEGKSPESINDEDGKS